MIVHFDFSRFHAFDPLVEIDLLRLVEQLTERNVEYLRAHETPPVYESGVRARTYAVKGCHHFSDIPAALRDGHASALSLAAWRCSEYRVQGVAARVRMRVRKHPGGGASLSFFVLLPDESEPSEEPFSKCRDAASDEVLDDCCETEL